MPLRGVLAPCAHEFEGSKRRVDAPIITGPLNRFGRPGRPKWMCHCSLHQLLNVACHQRPCMSNVSDNLPVVTGECKRHMHYLTVPTPDHELVTTSPLF